MSDLQYCPHCNSYHPASTSMTGCMRAPMAVTSGRHIVPPSLFLDQIEYVTRAEADAMVAAERERCAQLANDQAQVFRDEAHDQMQLGHREMHKRAKMIASFFDAHASAIRNGETP